MLINPFLAMAEVGGRVEEREDGWESVSGRRRKLKARDIAGHFSYTLKELSSFFFTPLPDHVFVKDLFRFSKTMEMLRGDFF